MFRVLRYQRPREYLKLHRIPSKPSQISLEVIFLIIIVIDIEALEELYCSTPISEYSIIP